MATVCCGAFITGHWGTLTEGRFQIRRIRGLPVPLVGQPTIGVFLQPRLGSDHPSTVKEVQGRFWASRNLR